MKLRKVSPDTWPIPAVVCLLFLFLSAMVAIALAAGAPVYGILENAPDDVTFAVYRNEPNPLQILTQANPGGGYSKPYWQLDTSNFSPEYESGAPMRVVFSDANSPSRFWEMNFANPKETTNLGEVPEGAPLPGGKCPAPQLSVQAIGNGYLKIDWRPTSGTVYDLYHTATGNDPVGNGRYDLLQADASPPYTHTNPAPGKNWYLLIAVDDNDRPLGCFSVSQGTAPSDATFTPTTTFTPRPTSTATPSPIPTLTPTNTATPSPTPTPTPTNTATPSPTPTSTPTNTATPTSTATREAAVSPTPTSTTITMTAPPTASSTPTATVTPSPSRQYVYLPLVVVMH